MNREIKKRWVNALQSGEYEQGQHQLHTEEGEFCCLGVLCDLAYQDGVIDRDLVESLVSSGRVYRYGHLGDSADPYLDPYSTGTLPGPVWRWANLNESNPEVTDDLGIARGVHHQDTLAGFNDTGVPFERIAQLIEEYL